VARGRWEVEQRAEVGGGVWWKLVKEFVCLLVKYEKWRFE
jgi:hypothetical protein